MRRWVLARARVWAGPEAGARGSAVAFDPAAGTVVAAGDEAAARAAAGDRAEVLDAGGRWLVPGFVDAHVHVAAAAAATAGDCSGVATGEGLLALVGEAARAGPGWVSLHGLEHRLAGGGTLDLPAPERLEAAAGGRPVRVRHRTLHGWYLGPRAAAAAGVAAGWTDDPTGEVARRLPPARPPDELESAVAAFSRRLLGLGVTALLDAGAANGPAELARLRDWHDRGVLRQAAAALGAGPAPCSAGRKLLPAPGCTEARMRRALRRAWAESALVAVHAADLETLGTLIAAAESLAGRGRLRVEHASVCPPEWVPRLARLGATVVTQPALLVEQGRRLLADPGAGPEAWLYRARSWLQAGVRLAFGSDAPAGPPAPLAALRAAVERRLAGGRSIGREEAIGPHAALAALTGWAADASGLAGHGRLAPGSAGSAVLLEGDPWTAPAAVAVAAVIHRGKLVRTSSPFAWGGG